MFLSLLRVGAESQSINRRLDRARSGSQPVLTKCSRSIVVASIDPHGTVMRPCRSTIRAESVARQLLYLVVTRMDMRS